MGIELLTRESWAAEAVGAAAPRGALALGFVVAAGGGGLADFAASDAVRRLTEERPKSCMAAASVLGGGGSRTGAVASVVS